MRVTVDLDEELVKQALLATKLPTTTALVEEGLRILLRREAGSTLTALGGSAPHIKGIRRRRRNTKGSLFR
jgi:Arc/MetJ family transcription regulator